jgi:hypothetical protein
MGRQDPTAPFQSGDAVLAPADDRFDNRALAPSAAPGTGRDRRALDSATRIRYINVPPFVVYRAGRSA